MSDSRPATTGRLMIPLVAVSLLCVAEAVVIAFLLGRGSPPPQTVSVAPSNPVSPNITTPPSATREAAAEAPAAAPAPAARGPATPAVAAPSVAAPSVVRGKVGQRVESAGLGLTVVKVANQPELGDVFKPAAGQKFVDVDVLIDNRTGKRFDYYSTQFQIKDDQDRAYSSGALGAGDPQLSWGNVVNGEKVRGHVAFVVPKDAKGLRLICPGPDTPKGSPAIYVDLGQ